MLIILVPKSNDQKTKKRRCNHRLGLGPNYKGKTNIGGVDLVGDQFTCPHRICPLPSEETLWSGKNAGTSSNSSKQANQLANPLPIRCKGLAPRATNNSGAGNRPLREFLERLRDGELRTRSFPETGCSKELGLRRCTVLGSMDPRRHGYITLSFERAASSSHFSPPPPIFRHAASKAWSALKAETMRLYLVKRSFLNQTNRKPSASRKTKEKDKRKRNPAPTGLKPKQV